MTGLPVQRFCRFLDLVILPVCFRMILLCCIPVRALIQIAACKSCSPPVLFSKIADLPAVGKLSLINLILKTNVCGMGKLQVITGPRLLTIDTKDHIL